MADDKKLVILKRITAVLQKITIANGYQHDLADRIFRGRVDFDKTNDPVPLITIFERSDIEQQTNANVRNQKHQYGWGLVAHGFCKPDKEHPIDPGFPLLADCKKALATISIEKNADYLLTTEGKKLISEIRLSPGIVVPPDREKSQEMVQFVLFFTVDLVESVIDPYLIQP